MHVQKHTEKGRLKNKGECQGEHLETCCWKHKEAFIITAHTDYTATNSWLGKYSPDTLNTVLSYLNMGTTCNLVSEITYSSFTVTSKWANWATDTSITATRTIPSPTYLPSGIIKSLQPACFSHAVRTVFEMLSGLFSAAEL